MNKRTAVLASLLLFTILVIIYLVYPIWLAFPSTSGKLVYYLLALLVALLSFYGFERLALKASKNTPKEKSEFWVWLVFFGILLLTHSWAMSMPLTYPGDEDYHFGRAAYLLKPIENVLKAHGLLWFGCLALLALLMLAGWFVFKWKKVAEFLHRNNRKVVVLIVLVALLFTLILHLKLSAIVKSQFPASEYQPGFDVLVRYPPLSAILYALTLLFFGYKLYFLRLVQVLFFSLGAFYLYKLLKLLTNREEPAWFGALLYAFVPAAFHYAHMGFLDGGQTFFEIAAAFYFVKYFKTRNVFYAIPFTILVVAGVLLKEFVILLIPLSLIYLVSIHMFEKKSCSWETIMDFFKVHKTFLLFSALAVFAVLPYFVTTNLLGAYNIYGTIVDPALIFGPYSHIMVKGFLVEFPHLLTVLFLLGLVYVLLTKRSDYSFVSFWFLFFFLFHASHMYGPELDVHRYSLHYTASVAALIAIVSFKLIERRAWAKYLPWALLMFIMSTTLYAAYSNIDDRYLPYDEAYADLSQLLQSGEKALALGAWSSYYRAKYDIDPNRLLPFEVISDRWDPVETQSLDRLYQQAKEEKVRFILSVDDLPAYVTNLFWPNKFTWGNENAMLNRVLIQELNKGVDQRFKPLRSFSHGVNRLTLFQVE